MTTRESPALVNFASRSSAEVISCTEPREGEVIVKLRMELVNVVFKRGATEEGALVTNEIERLVLNVAIWQIDVLMPVLLRS